jgi:small subunit ribosomal protein S17
MSETGSQKTLTGSVLGDKMDKTVVVGVERMKKHRRYGKYIKTRVKFKAHDEKNECGVGDKVMIVETRPQSKTKRWRVQQILEKAK